MPFFQRRNGTWVNMSTGAVIGTPPVPTVVLTGSVTASLAPSGRDLLVLGAYRPDASTTGVVAGTTLTITSSHAPVAGGFYQNLDIRNSVDAFNVNGAGVTYRNCTFRGKATALSGGAQGLVSLIRAHTSIFTFIDCTFVPQAPDYRWVGLHGFGYTAQRCDFSYLVDAFEVFNVGDTTGPANVRIEQTYVHDHAMFQAGQGGETSSNGSHADAIQWESGTGLIVRGNYFTGRLASGYGPGLGGGSNQNANSCMQIAPDVGLIGNGTITSNWFGGGGVPINIADKPAKSSYIDDIGTLSNNRFSRDSFYYPTMILIGSVAGGSHTAIGGTFTGNVFDDNGAPVNIVRTQG